MRAEQWVLVALVSLLTVVIAARIWRRGEARRALWRNAARKRGLDLGEGWFRALLGTGWISAWEREGSRTVTAGTTVLASLGVDTPAAFAASVGWDGGGELVATVRTGAGDDVHVRSIDADGVERFLTRGRRDALARFFARWPRAQIDGNSLRLEQDILEPLAIDALVESLQDLLVRMQDEATGSPYRTRPV